MANHIGRIKMLKREDYYLRHIIATGMLLVVLGAGFVLIVKQSCFWKKANFEAWCRDAASMV